MEQRSGVTVAERSVLDAGVSVSGTVRFAPQTTERNGYASTDHGVGLRRRCSRNDCARAPVARCGAATEVLVAVARSIGGEAASARPRLPFGAVA